MSDILSILQKVTKSKLIRNVCRILIFDNVYFLIFCKEDDLYKKFRQFIQKFSPLQ